MSHYSALPEEDKAPLTFHLATIGPMKAQCVVTIPTEALGVARADVGLTTDGPRSYAQCGLLRHFSCG